MDQPSPMASAPVDQGYKAPDQPTMIAEAVTPVVNPNWENDLWSCFDPTSTCCMGFWCPCVLHGQTHQRLRDPTATEVSPVNSSCAAFCGLLYCGGLGFVLAMMDRTEIREKFGISGSVGTDFLYSFCCSCCVIIQNAKEVEKRNAAAAGPVAYQSPNEKMQAP